MDEVTSRDEILANLLLLDNYVQHDQTNRGWAIGIIQGGEAFVAYQCGNRWLLGPSRFVGYVGNTRDKYPQAQRIGGAGSSTAIERALQNAPTPNQLLEQQYQQFCQQNGVNPHQMQAGGPHSRKFWVLT